MEPPWDEPSAVLEQSAVTVAALLGDRSSERPDHPFVVCDDDVLTYGEAASQSAALAKGLLAIGAGKGTHVGMLHPNGSELVVAWLAAARIGAVSLPLSTFSTSAELQTLLRNADIEMLLAATTYRGREYLAALRDAVPSWDPAAPPPILATETPSLRRVIFDRNPLIVSGAAVADELLLAVERNVGPADRMVIVHTSGSTSAPKGVIHQHGPLIRHLGILNELRHYDRDDVLFSNSPFFWIGGFAYSLLGTLVVGATLVCSNATAASDTLDLLERTRPTMVNGFAAAVAHLAKDPSFPERDLRSIRRGNLWPLLPDGVRPVDPELRHNMLGMTEAGSVCLASDDDHDQPEHRRGSFGRPVPGFESRIVDPDSGHVSGVGEPGELWLRGPALMEGYYGRERHETFTPDGWYRTGDLFRVDADGFHYFIGRRGDMIKTAGANVAPLEVEAAIADATGLVAHVVGIEDDERGQLVVAAVRLRSGHDVPDEHELRTALRQRLSAYKIPKRFVYLADHQVPMLSSGKLDGRALGSSSVADESATFPALLRRNRRDLGDAPAIVTEDRAITHAELDAGSHALARRLVAAGCGKSTRLALLAPNGIEWVLAASAAMRIGAVLVPLSTLLRPPELLAQVDAAAVTHLLAVRAFRGRRYLDELDEVVPGLRDIIGPGGRLAVAPSMRAVWAMPVTRGEVCDDEHGEMPNELVPSAIVDALEDQVRPADDLAVLFTSGSRGRPKGTIHTHGGALRAVASGLASRCVDRGTVLYIPMPFFWTGGFAAGLLSALVAGATLLTESEPEPAQTLALLERERATLFRGWPDQAARLASHPRFATTDLTSLGDGSLPAVLPSGRRPVPGTRPNVFGMTESFGPYCGDRLDQDLPELERGSCGRPFDGIEIRIVDVGTGQGAAVDEPGEIALRGPNLMRGICGRERAEVFSPDGFYATSDVGRLDRAGYLWYSGRLDDMFKVKGATVYPSEVEAALRALAEVREAYVTDVEGSDGAREVGALVVTDAPIQRVAAAVRERLSAFKVPTRWVVRSDPSAVPMLATGKVDLPALRAALSASEHRASEHRASGS